MMGRFWPPYFKNSLGIPSSPQDLLFPSQLRACFVSFSEMGVISRYAEEVLGEAGLSWLSLARPSSLKNCFTMGRAAFPSEIIWPLYLSAAVTG